MYEYGYRERERRQSRRISRLAAIVRAQKARSSLDLAKEGMSQLSLVNQGAVFVHELLKNEQPDAIAKGIAILLSAVVMLARRMSNLGQLAIAHQSMDEAEKLMAIPPNRYLH